MVGNRESKVWNEGADFNGREDKIRRDKIGFASVCHVGAFYVGDEVAFTSALHS